MMKERKRNKKITFENCLKWIETYTETYENWAVEFGKILHKDMATDRRFDKINILTLFPHKTAQSLIIPILVCSFIFLWKLWAEKLSKVNNIVSKMNNIPHSLVHRNRTSVVAELVANLTKRKLTLSDSFRHAN